jgi:hypothetical protein
MPGTARVVTCKGWDRKIHDVIRSKNGKLIVELDVGENTKDTAGHASEFTRKLWLLVPN